MHTPFKSFSLLSCVALLGACATSGRRPAPAPALVASPSSFGQAEAPRAPQEPVPTGRAPEPAAPAPSAALVPLPSVFDFTRGEGFGAALGVAVEFESAYDGSDEYEVEVEPVGAVQYRIGDQLLFWEGIEAGWRGLLTDRVLLQVGARYEGGREASDSDDRRLDGLDPVDDNIVGMVEFRYGLGDDWRGWVGGRVMAGESDFGVLGVLAAGYRFGDAVDGTGTEVLGFATFGDSTFLEKDFGITAAESVASGLPAAELDGGYRSFGLSVVHRCDLLERLQLIAEVGIEVYGDEIRDSAIARDDFEAEVGLALVWVF